MPANDPVITAMFINSYNADLAELGCTASVAAPQIDRHDDMLELRDDEGDFLDFIPAATEPRMAMIAYQLYGRAFNRGVRVGEEAAWAKLRHLIGAAPAGTTD